MPNHNKYWDIKILILILIVVEMKNKKIAIYVEIWSTFFIITLIKDEVMPPSQLGIQQAFQTFPELFTLKHKMNFLFYILFHLQ